METLGVGRREFISGLALLSLAGDSDRHGFTSLTSPSDEMPYRPLGKTGEKVSCIGLGGYHLGQSYLGEADAIRLFHGAVDRGINFSDNSWDYNQGESERRVGKALKGYRQKVFVMTKFDGRTKGSALTQLDESLQRLQVDHVDLWQFHENIRLEDPDRFFAEGGAVEAMMAAKQAGKIRYSALPAIKIQAFTFACSNWQTNTVFRSTLRRCPLMSWMRTSEASKRKWSRFSFRNRSACWA